MIAGQTISLQPFDSCHLDATREWFNNPEFARLLNRSRRISDEEHRSWFESLGGQTDMVYFAVESNNNARAHIGNVWLANLDSRHKKAELRIVIGESDYRGAGSEAIDLLCRHAFQQLQLHKVYAYVLAINPRAKRAFEKAGFEVEGVLREDRWAEDRYVDVYLLGRLNLTAEGTI